MAASSSALNSRFGKCEVCCQAPARYRCPRCTLCSCSLPCVKRHKAEHDCNGLRDKTAYVSMKRFSDLNLLSDYRFLEELGRSVDNASRDSFHQNPRFRNHLPYWLHRLVTECRLRETQLLIMPQNFTRRKQNTSVFVAGKKRMILWHVEWQFPQADVTYTDSRIPEDTPLSEALEKYLNPALASEEVRQRLAFYQSAGYNKVSALMKVEFKEKDSPGLYKELKISESLRWNLYKKTIIEFPTIFVALKDHLHMYPLAETDTSSEDSDEEAQPAMSVQRTSVVMNENAQFKAEESGCISDLPISDLSDDDQCASEVPTASTTDLPMEKETLKEPVTEESNCLKPTSQGDNEAGS